MERKRSRDEEEPDKKKKKLKKSETSDQEKGETSNPSDELPGGSAGPLSSQTDSEAKLSETERSTVLPQRDPAFSTEPMSQRPGCSNPSSNLPTSKSSVPSLRLALYSMTEPIKKLSRVESSSEIADAGVQRVEGEESENLHQEEEASSRDEFSEIDIESLLDEIEEVEEEDSPYEDVLSSTEDEHSED